MTRLAWLAAVAPIIVVVAVTPKQGGGGERGGVDVGPAGAIVVPPSPIGTHVEGLPLREKRKRPNILLLLADDLGYGEVEGFSPYPRIGDDAVTGTTVSDRTIRTPELSRLRSEGVSMTNFYAGEAVCAPSRCALFTGKHTGHATVRGNAKGPDGYDFPLRETPDDVTLAEILRDGAGYDTAMVGKWCFGGPESRSSPWLKGFDRFFGHLNQAAAHNMYPRYLWERWGDDDANEDGEGGASKVPYPENVNATRERCMLQNSTCRYSHSLFVERVLDFLDEHHANKSISDDSEHSDGDGSSTAEGTASSADHQRPFFLFVSFTVPHAGGWTGEGIRGSFPERGNPVPSDGRYANRADWPEVERDHASSITEYLDRDVGRILSRLDELGATEDTLVIFTSDNGPHDEGGHDVNFFDSAGPLRGYKRSLYEGGIRVPFVARWPGGGIGGGRTTDAVAWFPDLMATFAQAAGIDDGLIPDDTDGYSILGLLTGGDDGLDDGATNRPPTPPEDRVLYWEFCTGGMWGQAVRRRDMKLVSLDRPDSPWELYNLTSDPAESSCLAKQHSDVVKALEREAENSHMDDPNWPTGRGCRSSDSFELSVSFALQFS